MKNIGAFKKSLIISIIYVGLSILALLAIYPGSSFYGVWSLFVLNLTLPVSFLSFCLIYAGTLDEVGILQVQWVMYLITWFFLYCVIKKIINNSVVSLNRIKRNEKIFVFYSALFYKHSMCLFPVK